MYNTVQHNTMQINMVYCMSEVENYTELKRNTPEERQTTHEKMQQSVTTKSIG